MIKKFLATASVLGLVAGAASALELSNTSAGSTGGDPVPLAAELDYAGGAVVSDPASDETRVEFTSTGASFPSGNVLVFVEVEGAVFDSALTGDEVDGTGVTSVISEGGAAGSNQVTFLISGADACDADDTCEIDLPLELDGSDVVFNIGLETDAGAPVDNTDEDDREAITVVDVETAWDFTFAADTGDTIARLDAPGGPFVAFTAGSDTLLGTAEVSANAVDFDGAAGPNPARTVLRSLTAADEVTVADVLSLEFVLSGSMNAFEDGDVTFEGNSADDIDATTDEATYEDETLFGTEVDVAVSEDGTTAIERSDYEIAATVTPTVASPLTAGATASGDLQRIDREGTQITFPWTQSQTQGAASGVNSVFRFGNLDNAAAGAVFAEVKNASAAGYTNPGIVQLASSIAANGELVTNSTQLEAALGDYGRGDVEFTIEAEADTLTGRQFVVRNGVIQNVIGGNIEQDLQ